MPLLEASIPVQCCVLWGHGAKPSLPGIGDVIVFWNSITSEKHITLGLRVCIVVVFFSFPSTEWLNGRWYGRSGSGS